MREQIDWTFVALVFGGGLVPVLFPASVVRFYKWFHGPHALRVQQLEPRHARNAGIVWIVIMAVIAYATDGFRHG
jgi:hypothetical protein